MEFKDSKEIRIKSNFYYGVMPMMTSQVINLWISQNHKNQDVSRAKHCFSSNKKYRYIKGYFMTKNSFVVEVVTFKDFANFPMITSEISSSNCHFRRHFRGAGKPEISMQKCFTVSEI